MALVLIDTMKTNLFRYTILLLLVIASLPASGNKREQRAAWMSGFVSDWPSSAITTANAETHKRQCREHLDTMQMANFTTVYYHVRTMCDAMYDSKYEPWSSYVSGTRGKAPAFDPFAYILEQAHARGLEVYAWLNPYRYINSSYSSGYGNAGGDKNYENSHPEWLIEWNNGGTTWTILNPALPEVKQRIVDVIADIMSKYDIDGVIFDDYFYQNGLPESYDAADYTKYTEGGGTLSQADWRRENVNDMVRMVNAYIKSTKPWVRFGIGPAGVAGKPEVTAKYGLPACPGSDWQYNGISSDPLAWLAEGSIDFISPQVYWNIGNENADFANITPWWYMACKKFNRHCYISQSLTGNFGKASSLDEFVNQVEMIRSSNEQEACGYVFFPWRFCKNYTKEINGVKTNIPTYFRRNVYAHKALSPVVTWMPSKAFGKISNLTRNGRKLTWTGEDNVKYSIYAVPKSVKQSEFRKEQEYLMGISYEASYSIPETNPKYPEQGVSDADLDKYNYAVCVLDRYGNEYAAFFTDPEAADAKAPVLTYPTNGVETPSFFNFKWEGNGQNYELVVAEDSELKNIVYKTELSDQYKFSADVYGFEAGKTYYWRVSSRANNVGELKSEVRSFKVDEFRVKTPIEGSDAVADNPEISWSVVEGADKYKLEISNSKLFKKVTVVREVKEAKCQIEPYLLSGNTTYYVRVSTELNGRSFVTKESSFRTVLIEGVKPEIVRPLENGQTLYSNNTVGVAPQRGITVLRIMISPNEKFSARSSYNGTFTQFETSTPELSTIKVGSSKLADGKTYYVRAQVSYIGAEGGTVTSEWSDVKTFVYSSEHGGVSSITGAALHYADGILMTGMPGASVAVYGISGALAGSYTSDRAGNADLTSLPSGVYVAKVSDGIKVENIKIVK